MVKCILIGAEGHMGRVVSGLLQSNPSYSLACGVDICGDKALSLEQAMAVDADVILDFSHHSAVPDILDFALKRKLPLLIATTGHTEEEYALIEKGAAHIPIWLCANFSPAMGWLSQTVKDAAAQFPLADVEILEAHRKGKADAPGGTAKVLSHIISSAGKKSPAIHSMRLGHTVGTHSIIFDTGEEQIIVTHIVHRREAFAKGALEAAKILLSKPIGLYTDFLLKERI
ncbi:MAG: hypothetical protein J6R42_02630 [Clostridia bacterium]|nr:hypothetical protein [Clostridia bacterium]